MRTISAERRTSIDFAECMRELADVHYRDAEQIRVVLDNLSTHGPGALYEAFEPEARCRERRLPDQGARGSLLRERAANDRPMSGKEPGGDSPRLSQVSHGTAAKPPAICSTGATQ